MENNTTVTLIEANLATIEQLDQAIARLKKERAVLVANNVKMIRANRKQG